MTQTMFLQTPAGECPDCGSYLWCGTKILKKLHRGVMVLTCHECDFYWPANADTFYDSLFEKEETAREKIARRLNNIKEELHTLLWLHQDLTSLHVEVLKNKDIVTAKYRSHKRQMGSIYDEVVRTMNRKQKDKK